MDVCNEIPAERFWARHVSGGWMGRHSVSVCGDGRHVMLNRYLSRHHLTRAAFARSLGVTSQCVSRWCHGRAIPRAGMLQAIADLTNGEIPVEFWTRLALERPVKRRDKGARFTPPHP